MYVAAKGLGKCPIDLRFWLWANIVREVVSIVVRLSHVDFLGNTFSRIFYHPRKHGNSIPRCPTPHRHSLADNDYPRLSYALIHIYKQTYSPVSPLALTRALKHLLLPEHRTTCFFSLEPLPTFRNLESTNRHLSSHVRIYEPDPRSSRRSAYA